jgi:hypothetical protein
MAIVTAVHLKVPFMGEPGVGCKRNILDRMALAAFGRHRESGFAIVTGTAGQPLLHLLHGIGFSLGAGGKQLVVTVIAFVHAQMDFVAEIHFPGTGNIKNYVFGADVASVAAPGNAEGNIGIVTGAAGTVLFHLTHTIPAAPLPPGKYATVAIYADIHVLGFVGMNFMAEESSTCPEVDVW